MKIVILPKRGVTVYAPKSLQILLRSTFNTEHLSCIKSSFEKSVSSEEPTSDEVGDKRKQCRWTTEMVGDLIRCLKGYKVKMEFQGFFREQRILLLN